MQHSDDLDPILYHFIKDYIPPERKATYSWSQFLPAASEQRLLGQDVKSRVHVLDECIRPRQKSSAM